MNSNSRNPNPYNRPNQALQSHTPHSSQPSANPDMSQKQLGLGMGAAFCLLFVVVGLLNLAFIIPDFIFANQANTCVTTIMQGISFPLKTWLLVDAYARIVITSLLLIVAVVSCANTAAGIAMAACVTCTMILYSLFMFAWIIVGAVLFWGKLNPAGLCEGGVRVYMWVLLILSLVSLCCNLMMGNNGGIGGIRGTGGVGGRGVGAI